MSSSSVRCATSRRSRRRWGRDEHLCSQDSSAAAGLGYKLLRKYAEQDEGKLDPYLLLLMRGEDVYDPVYCLDRVRCMQRRKDEVTCFSDIQRRLDRLEVAHLTDEDDIRVLPQDMFQRVRE